MGIFRKVIDFLSSSLKTPWVCHEMRIKLRRARLLHNRADEAKAVVGPVSLELGAGARNANLPDRKPASAPLVGKRLCRRQRASGVYRQ